VRFKAPIGYPQILDIVDLSPLQGRPCQTPCSYARRSRCLYTSFDQNHDSVFFSFLSIKQYILSASMLGDYSTSASLTPSCFLRRTDLFRNLFPITLLLDLLVFFFSFFFGTSYQASCPQRCSDTSLWVHLWCPLNVFIVVSIYWKTVSYRSSLDLSSLSKTTNRSAAKLASFFFWTNMHAIRIVDSSTTSSWPF
jgi:hypothetical protein